MLPEGGSIIVTTLSVRPSQYLVRQITLKLLMPFKSNLVYRYMAVRGSAVYKNHNSTLYICSVIPLNHFS